MWLTSMPHTLSTFTRRDLRKPRWVAFAILVFSLLAFTFYGIEKSGDLSAVFLIYFFAQQFNYALQSFGVSLLTHPKRPSRRILDHAFFLGVPAMSLLASLSQGPQGFFGYAIINPTPFRLDTGTALALNAILTLLFCYGKRERGAWVYGFTHAVLYSAALLSGVSFFVGWFTLNLFHNLQYLALMMHQEGSIHALALPFGLTALLYLMGFLVPGLVPFLALNFTHYLWDSLIWRTRFFNQKLLINPSLRPSGDLN
jgi:hypothetical protein